jgi:hypothetical protein
MFWTVRRTFGAVRQSWTRLRDQYPTIRWTTRTLLYMPIGVAFYDYIGTPMLVTGRSMQVRFDFLGDLSLPRLAHSAWHS